MSSGGGSGSSNTVTSVQQIPEFEQESSRQNQALAQSIGSQPYPVYQAQLIQGQDPLQKQGQAIAADQAASYIPYLSAAAGTTNDALQGAGGVNGLVGQARGQIGGAMDAGGLNAFSGAAAGSAAQAQRLTNPNAVGAYMSPFIAQALAPQIQDLGLQLSQQQKAIDTQSTQANAFGDARQGTAQALQNLYGNQALNQLIGTGYNNAYTQALAALGQAQGTNLAAGQQYGNLASLQGQEQQTQLAGAKQIGDLAGILGTEQQTQLAGGQQLSNIAGLAQQLGLARANAVYNVGAQNQQFGQQQLNAAYQQYLNQINWPVQMLNVRESALSNSPYNIASAVTLPQGNAAAQGLGSGISLASLAAQLAGGGSGSTAPFGGSQVQGTK